MSAIVITTSIEIPGEDLSLPPFAPRAATSHVALDTGVAE